MTGSTPSLLPCSFAIPLAQVTLGVELLSRRCSGANGGAACACTGREPDVLIGMWASAIAVVEPVSGGAVAGYTALLHLGDRCGSLHHRGLG